MLALSHKLSVTATSCRRLLRDIVDVKQEKQHNDLIHGVENFSTRKLKHTDTLEKVILPNAEGTYFL